MFRSGAESLADWAVTLAENLLAVDLPQRWAHTQSVIRRARDLRDVVGPDEELLVAAAALHDVGFAPGVQHNGFCLLDAAELIDREGGPPRLADLIANHALGRVEGNLRGFGQQMADFLDEQSAVRDALWYSCLTVGPEGQDVSIDQRISGWSTRYADDPVITKYVEIAKPELLAAVARTAQRTAAVRT